MTEAERVGMKLAAWTELHPVAAKLIVWCLVVAVAVGFVTMVWTEIERGRFYKLLIPFVVGTVIVIRHRRRVRR